MTGSARAQPLDYAPNCNNVLTERSFSTFGISQSSHLDLGSCTIASYRAPTHSHSNDLGSAGRTNLDETRSSALFVPLRRRRSTNRKHNQWRTAIA